MAIKTALTIFRGEDVVIPFDVDEDITSWTLSLYLSDTTGDSTPTLTVSASITKIAEAAGRRAVRRPQRDRALLVTELASAYNATSPRPAGWSRDSQGKMAGPFIRFVKAVFAAAHLPAPAREIVDRGLLRKSRRAPVKR